MAAEDVPVEVKDRLSAALADIDEDAVVLEARLLGCLGHEVEHALRLVRRELTDVAKRGDVTLRQHEQVRVGAGVDVPDRDEAVAGFRAALKLKPDFPEAHNNLGIALGSQGKLDEAIEEFRRALAIRKDFADAQKNLETALKAESLKSKVRSLK